MSVFSDTFKTNEHWSNYIINTQYYKYNFCEGAYRSSKSVSNTLAFALYLESTPDKVHLVIASTVASARAIVEDGDGALGLRYYFATRYRPTKYKGNDAGIIKTPTGEKVVVYLGGSMESSFKIFRGWSVGGIVLEEANLLHENTINEAKGRTLMAKEPRYFISMNPTTPKHKIYKWLDELQSKDIVNYDHSTIYDNPAITDERRDEIISEFDPDSIWYRQYILGERVNPEGQIFQLNDYNLMESYDPKDYSFYITVADPGKSKSATSFIMAAYNYKEKSIDILEEYWYKNPNNTIAIKHSRDTVKDFLDFNKRCAEIMNRWPQVCILDSFPSDDFFDYAFTDSRAAGLPLDIKMPIDSEGKGGKDEDEVRISRTTTLLFTGKLRFMNHCTHCIDDLSTLEYDSKALEKGHIKIAEVFDGSGHGDAADSVFYATTYLKNFVL